MTAYLRGNEILACVHRVALSRGEPFDYVQPPIAVEMARRRRNAREHLRSTLELLRQLHPDASAPMNQESTTTFLRSGQELVLMPRLASDDVGRRVATVHALVRVGRVGDHFTYAPILIKNHEAVETASTRRTLEGALERIRPGEATYHDGVGVRSAPPMTRTGLALAHATRVLGALGHADASARGGVIDRHRRLWWFELAGDGYPRFNLNAYDRLYDERLTVLSAHDQWSAAGGAFPTAPYWHRDCPLCPYSAYCEAQLEEIDDVSLVRFTTIEQQLLLREHGLETRAQLARLDPHRAVGARHKTINPLERHQREESLGRSIENLDELIYRARVHERGTPLRIVDSRRVGCPRADVEVDLDMESYDDATYLWGAYVTLNRLTDDVPTGYSAFAVWGELTHDAEATIFADLWRWLDRLRRTCLDQGRTFAAYCFWAQAEDRAMNRAVDPPLADGPTAADLSDFRHSEPPQWIDLHEQTKRQIQTDGPLGLKQLAMGAGFHWRDPNPSGEASILWYEESTRDSSPAALAARTRLLEYNEDDCRATKALRDWLCGPARDLPHRDDPL